MSPLVSVIVPVFNGARFIEEALNSVVAQGHDRIEVIVIDDASTDDSVNLLRPRRDISLIELPVNSGPSVARNRGLDHASGDFIAFIDSDDIWMDNKLQLQLDWFRSRPESTFVTGFQQAFIEPGCRPPLWAQKMAAKPMLGGVPSGWLIRREAFERVGRFDPTYRHAEDIDWMARAARAGVALDCIEHVIFRKRIHDENLTLDREPSDAGLFRALRASVHRHRGEAE